MVRLLGAFIDAAYALVVLRRPRRVACSGKSDQGSPAAPADVYKRQLPECQGGAGGVRKPRE